MLEKKADEGMTQVTPKIILIVCTGNMCRSPMVEGLLRRKLAQADLLGEFTVASAGVWTEDGCPATDHAVRAMAEQGIDISTHRSRNVTGEMVAQAALVLTMTRNHAEAIRQSFTAYAGKVHLLSEMGGSAYDVNDPVGRPLAVYQTTAKDLERLIESGYERILRLARGEKESA